VRFAISVLILTLTIAFVGGAIATPPGVNVEWGGGWAGRVIYDGTIHGPAKRMKCTDCHPALFPMRKSPDGTYTKVSMIAGENCGACHDGIRAFATFTPDFTTCARCHKPEPVAPPAPAP